MIEKVKKSAFWRILLALRKCQTLNLISTLKPLVVKNSPRYIISLTSYKNRLTDTAPYAIITLLNQSVQPDKIILWVAYEDKEKIPQVMEKLTQKGLEIRFCEDVRSYKKLIPALEAFPDDYIITADDDVYYPRIWFERLLDVHKENPKKIICHRAHGIKTDENHYPLPYNIWEKRIKPGEYFAIRQNRMESIFPTGIGGILYPPDCFYKDVTNKDFFMEFAPQADDIWFWAMAVINREYFSGESPYIVIKNNVRRLQSIDVKQKQGENVLLNYNVLQGGNDKQIKMVIKQYPQIREYLRRIIDEK